MRLYQPSYTKDRPTGHGFLDERVTKKSTVWWVDFTVDGKSRRRSTGLRDKAAATVKAAGMVRDAELKAAGIDTHGETTRATLACLLDEYRVNMAHRGLAAKHVATTVARCAAVLAPATTITAVSTPSVRLGLERLRGASAKTINGYRTAVHGFFAWLVKEGRWASNPVEAVARTKEIESPGDSRRRALTPDEQRSLLLTGKHNGRWLVYHVALNTGLRRAELDAMTYDDLLRVPDEDGALTRYAVRVRAKSAKNRKEAVLPLPRGTDIATPMPGAKPCTPPSMAAFRRDLRDAGIAESSPDGVVDFHSLRVTFATNLARAGVPLTMAQRLMRHSDPALTANIYTRLTFGDGQSAVDSASLRGTTRTIAYALA